MNLSRCIHDVHEYVYVQRGFAYYMICMYAYEYLYAHMTNNKNLFIVRLPCELINSMQELCLYLHCKVSKGE